MLFFFIRHGDPIYDPDSLTPLGQRQAEAVAKRLAMHGIDRIYASSSNRAQQTARPTSEIVKKEIVTLDWCNESHAWRELTVNLTENRKTWLFHHAPTREILNSASVRALGRNWFDHPAFANKGYKEGIQRIQTESDAFFASLGYEHDAERGGYIPVRPNSERVALFAHQGFSLAFMSCLLDIPYPLFCTRFDFGHTGLTVIDFDGKGDIIFPHVLTMANDSHIYREGLPTSYQNEIYF